MRHRPTSFEVRRPSSSVDMIHFSVSAVIGLVTFELLTLKLVGIIVHGVDNLPSCFYVSVAFRFRLMGQHLD